MNLPLYTVWFINFEGNLDHVYAHTTAAANKVVWELHKQHYTGIEVWSTHSMTDVTKDFKRLM